MSNIDKKWAVLCVHGMGDPLPMTTVNEIFGAVYSSNTNLIESDRPNPNNGDKRRDQNFHWTKPDPLCGSAELRRLTTETLRGPKKDFHNKRLDFFEHYWADATHDNQWHHVQGWLIGLVLRWPWQTPHALLAAYLAIWGFALFGVALIAIAFGLPELAKIPSLAGLVPGFAKTQWFPIAVTISWPIVMFIVNLLAHNVLVHKFGDVARFLEAKPKNIEAREKIRSRGVSLLQGLIDSKKYERIIVVGHSLGSIVAYEMLSTAFQKYCLEFACEGQDQKARNRLEVMINEGLQSPNSWNLDEYQKAQREALQEAIKNGSNWNVTDFVTLGSPITHAEILLAKNKDDLLKRQQRRELGTCPPQPEWDSSLSNQNLPALRFTWDRHVATKRDPLDCRVPHFAAAFAYTRWTNIYSPRSLPLMGDLISGPLKKAVGLKNKNGQIISGVKEIAVLPQLTEDGKVKQGQRRQFFTHTHYWNPAKPAERKLGKGETPAHIKEFRKALGLD